MNTGFPLDTYNRKDLEEVRMERARAVPLTDAQKRTLMIRTLNREYGTRNLQYLGVGEDVLVRRVPLLSKSYSRKRIPE